MKDYSKWYGIKSSIEHFGKETLFRDREIWWCSLGENIGYEQDGKNEKYDNVFGEIENKVIGLIKDKENGPLAGSSGA